MSTKSPPELIKRVLWTLEDKWKEAKRTRRRANWPSLCTVWAAVGHQCHFTRQCWQYGSVVEGCTKQVQSMGSGGPLTGHFWLTGGTQPGWIHTKATHCSLTKLHSQLFCANHYTMSLTVSQKTAVNVVLVLSSRLSRSRSIDCHETGPPNIYCSVIPHTSSCLYPKPMAYKLPFGALVVEFTTQLPKSTVFGKLFCVLQANKAPNQKTAFIKRH
jgi:hypothetical protein